MSRELSNFSLLNMLFAGPPALIFRLGDANVGAQIGTGADILGVQALALPGWCSLCQVAETTSLCPYIASVSA
jgi:hypothetical protein